ncbi:cysteine desulfurase family protein [Candidatus Neomarinimicrobiota bacterium]
MKAGIYLDNHSTTPVDPQVLEAMLPFFTQRFGNPASQSHAYGWDAGKAVDQARQQVAQAIGATPIEIYFTSGATESINLALKGAAEMYRSKGRHIVIVATEHNAVLDTCAALRPAGFEITVLPVKPDGHIDMEVFGASFRSDTILACVMHANNETGVIHDIGQAGAICRANGVFLMVDAAQSVTKVPVDVDAMKVDLLALSGHKFYGPKGVGALYVRRKGPQIRLVPQIHGGGHERGLRSGTLPTPLIVGLGKAIEMGVDLMESESARILRLRERLIDGIQSGVSGVELNGDRNRRLAGNANLTFLDLDGAALLAGLSSLSVSSGAACSSAEVKPSHVLKAMGRTDELANASIRFGIGRFNSESDIDQAVKLVIENVKRLRKRRLDAT